MAGLMQQDALREGCDNPLLLVDRLSNPLDHRFLRALCHQLGREALGFADALDFDGDRLNGLLEAVDLCVALEGILAVGSSGRPSPDPAR